ncbi:MAG: LysR family transcriptional regulator [Pseudoflavonifractor capillosus]|uniref:LysR family transcriptional regulator n=1 Tax=Pseudoflavonifractor capillosus TaxID=106588 RepID=UPI0023F6AF71|nr:LysR family transcriptional regulator [Pseudoflavonifractor capillosus]MCI5929524.1 LysR family transcriptional regulator [Pseudoflavonifractor capillosus]MDY4661492.1 LysR family transcriptional regulator [Pseudoflavonifractor capillosus]
MELRVLQYFLAVAREQNISAAAQSLHLTQPTLSRQLMELEKELGKQLMVRGSRKITLTEDGMRLRRRAEEILELVDRTEKEVMQSDDTVSGDIYIGTGETDGVRQIVKAANQLQGSHPGIRFHIVSGDAMDVCERLDKGLLDFGILLGDMDKTRYSCMELPMKDTWGVLMRRDSPLAQRETVSPRDLWDKPLILSRQVDNKSGLYRWLRKEPSELHTVATYNLIYNASLMVDEGMGYAFTLDKLVNTTGSNLCFRPMKPKMELGMYLVWKKSQLFSRAAELFLEKLQAQLVPLD